MCTLKPGFDVPDRHFMHQSIAAACSSFCSTKILV